MMIAKTYPEAIYAREEVNGMLPLHIAASTAQSENGVVNPTSSAVIELLLKYAPHTKILLDRYGDTPVDLAWREASFCCYKCGNGRIGPCLCKNVLSVPEENLHPLLREVICAQLSPTTDTSAISPSKETQKQVKIVGPDEYPKDKRDDTAAIREDRGGISRYPVDKEEGGKKWNMFCTKEITSSNEGTKKNLRILKDPAGDHSKWYVRIETWMEQCFHYCDR
jgi:hypothetical protein